MVVFYFSIPSIILAFLILHPCLWSPSKVRCLWSLYLWANCLHFAYLGGHLLRYVVYFFLQLLKFRGFEGERDFFSFS